MVYVDNFYVVSINFIYAKLLNEYAKNVYTIRKTT
jgi:hypothetical protein